MLISLIENPDRRMRIVSGVQPSGRLHLGNYYGAVHQLMELQNDGKSYPLVPGTGRAREIAAPIMERVRLAVGIR